MAQFGDVHIHVRSKLSVVVCLTITLILVALKLTETFDLPWWVVLLPMYGPLILAAVIYVGFCVYNRIEDKHVRKEKERVSNLRREQLEKRKSQQNSE